MREFLRKMIWNHLINSSFISISLANMFDKFAATDAKNTARSKEQEFHDGKDVFSRAEDEARKQEDEATKAEEETTKHEDEATKAEEETTNSEGLAADAVGEEKAKTVNDVDTKKADGETIENKTVDSGEQVEASCDTAKEGEAVGLEKETA